MAKVASLASDAAFKLRGDKEDGFTVIKFRRTLKCFEYTSKTLSMNLTSYSVQEGNFLRSLDHCAAILITREAGDWDGLFSTSYNAIHCVSKK